MTLLGRRKTPTAILRAVRPLCTNHDAWPRNRQVKCKALQYFDSVYCLYITPIDGTMKTLTHRPLQVYLRPEQLEALRFLARRRDVSIAELVRQGVDRLLAEVPADEDPLWGIVGQFDSGLGDLSEQHDTYLARWTAKASQ